MIEYASESSPKRTKAKGQYADYDTFLGPEAAESLRLYTLANGGEVPQMTDTARRFLPKRSPTTRH